MAARLNIRVVQLAIKSESVKWTLWANTWRQVSLSSPSQTEQIPRMIDGCSVHPDRIPRGLRGRWYRRQPNTSMTQAKCQKNIACWLRTS